MPTNPTTALPAVGNFNGTWFEDDLAIACHIADHPEGSVGIATPSIPGTSLQDVGYGIAWTTDDNGRIHYAATDGSAWPAYAATVEEALDLVVAWAIASVDPDYPVDIAYDDRIPALSYGDQFALLATIPTN